MTKINILKNKVRVDQARSLAIAIQIIEELRAEDELYDNVYINEYTIDVSEVVDSNNIISYQYI